VVSQHLLQWLAGIDRVGGGEFAVSWDATLIDDRGHVEFDVNYTHNCNGMANAVLNEDASETGHSWWRELDQKNGLESVGFLNRIISGLEADPHRFRAMNPDNGWGDYDSFLALLKRMRDAVPAWPTAWSVSG
jgi:hypothetical protein